MNKKKLKNIRIITISDNDGQQKVIEFDKLERKNELGCGRFASVVKYCHKDDGTVFAVKRIENEDHEDSTTASKDIDVLSKIGGSPFTIKFYGAFQAEGAHWLLTECMDISLDKFYKKAHTFNASILNELFLSKVAYSILKAIEFLKHKNIIHRDIKPSNMLINYDSAIKLCDFGISGFLQNSIAKTNTGTLVYMSPEKIRVDENGYTIKSDIWSLGISLVEIALGMYPYFIYSKNILGLVLSILEKDPPKLSSTIYNNECCDFIDLCLRKEPDKRGNLSVLLSDKFLIDNIEKQLDTNALRTIIDSI